MTRYVVRYLDDGVIRESKPMRAKYALAFLNDIATMGYLVVNVDKQ